MRHGRAKPCTRNQAGKRACRIAHDCRLTERCLPAAQRTRTVRAHRVATMLSPRELAR
ncbi:MAG TPA: hypothetical protein VK803_06675 [Steroidobacteraceae bacterium]|nr:hypothetical protein [Steroidobacteraceae bacterium]